MPLLLFACLVAFLSNAAFAADWPALGRDVTRNPVSPEQDAPTDWDIGKFDRKMGQFVEGTSRNIKWTAEVGFAAFGTPVVADGLVWIGGHRSRLRDQGTNEDPALLLCLDEQTGELLYEYVSPRLPSGRVNDPSFHGLSSSPLVEGDRLWFVTNRCETVCLDIGPLKQEPRGEPRSLWKVDMREKFGVFPRPAFMGPGRLCSIAPSLGGLIFVATGNGVDESYVSIPAPEAPGLIAFDSQTGDAKWQVPTGTNILHSELASPLVAEIGGRAQVIMPHGDGWLRSYDPSTGTLLWEFDVNPKESLYRVGGRSTRNYFLSPPVLYDDRIYIAGGQDIENGEGEGRLVCIDPTKSGDVSSELAVDKDGQPIPPRRLQCVDAAAGEKAVPNPNSALVWDFDIVEAADFNGDGKINGKDRFMGTMHRTCGTAAIKDELLVITDVSGVLHCLHAKTGQQHWAFDLLMDAVASPLIVDDKVYIGDGDGDLSIFPLTADPEVALKKIQQGRWKGRPIPGIGTMRMGSYIYASPIYANGVLYVTNRSTLFAIQSAQPEE
jgi:outer membrane protein assembly factor BamB